MNVLPIRAGITNCCVVQDKGIIMVDGGPPDKLKTLLRRLRKAAIDPRQIKLIVYTHGHLDHVGSARALKEATGAQIAMRSPDRDWLEQSRNQLPPPATRWGRIMMGLMSGYVRRAKVPAAKVDIALNDAEFSLARFGVTGRVLCTPGHSMGSLSVVLDDGKAFVGDLAMNGLPFRIGPGLPIFADDLEVVKKSWRMLFSLGVKTIYPGHGKPFSVDALRQSIG